MAFVVRLGMSCSSDCRAHAKSLTAKMNDELASITALRKSDRDDIEALESQRSADRARMHEITAALHTAQDAAQRQAGSVSRLQSEKSEVEVTGRMR